MARQASGIYFILAPDYHGAAQLSLILNNHNDIFSLGDGNPLRSEDQVCSCSTVVSACPFWTEMALATEAGEDDPLPNLLPQVPYLVQNKNFNNALNGIGAVLAHILGSKLWRGVYEQAERFMAIHERFLSACYAWVPHKVFVDAERSALKFMVMASMDFPVKGIIHLARDPRGYAASAKGNSSRMTAEQLGQEWQAGHDRIRRISRIFSKVPYCTVRYEDLVENPDEAIKKLLNFMRLEESPLLHAPDNQRKHHLIGVEGFDGTFKEDRKWQDSLHPEDQTIVLSVCGPLFSEFGYKS